MIDINRETGTVTWDGFTLHPQLTHDELIQTYLNFTVILDQYDVHQRKERIYNFPRTVLGEYYLIPEVRCWDNRLSTIDFMREPFGHSDDEIDHWRREPKWAVFAQKWLKTQLGNPHMIEPGVLYDEAKYLSPNEIKFLQSWQYKFTWGKASFYYDSLYMPGAIYIHYDYHQRISSWDKLTEECDRLLQNEQERNNGFYAPHLLATRSLIDILQPNFDFQKIKPHVHATGLSFPILGGTIKVVIEVRPKNVSKKYKISRPDTTKTSFIAEGDNSRLIDELRLFLEAETL